jgi:hypothetical protein
MNFNTTKQLEGTLLYVNVQEPVKAYVKEGSNDRKPDEYTASVAITDEDTLDAFEAYLDTIKAKSSIKKIKTMEFEAKYKCEVPEGAGKNIWVVTLRKSTEIGKTGKPIPDSARPKVLEVNAEGKVVDVTAEKLPANGSKGIISFTVYNFTQGAASGTSKIELQNILVTELIKYVPLERSAGREFSSVAKQVGQTKDLGTRKETPEDAEKSKAKGSKPSKVQQDDADDDIPF